MAAFLDLRALNFLESEAYRFRTEVYAATPGPRQARERICLVLLSDKSFDKLSGRPVPRTCHAKVIDDLTNAGARAIALDLKLHEEKEEDRELAAAAARSEKVVWGCEVDRTDENPPKQSVRRPTRELREQSPDYGHLCLGQDPESLHVDRVRPGIQHGDESIPAFSLMTVMMAEGLQDQDLRPVDGEWQVRHIRVPVDIRDQFRISYMGRPIRYVGEPGATFDSVEYLGVHEGRIGAGSFRDRVVLIGEATDADRWATPVGMMWGVEIHAHAVATLLEKRFIREAPWWGNFLAICLLAGLVCPLAGACRLRWAALATAALLIAYFILNAWLFVDDGYLLHLAGPTTAAVLVTLGLLTERSITEEREKNRIRGLLQRYVSPQVAEHIIDNPNAYVRGGVEKSVSVLFSDIRGFSVISQQMDPQQVVAYLNDYLQAMTDAVFEHDGAIDKYAGDGIMALFGVPVAHEDHARRAVATAIDMQAALLKLQAHWATQGLPVADIGIGINTGEVVVGNIGSTQRVDFTVIGDPVNLAERVEGLTKVLSARILVTEATYRHIQGEVRAHGPMTAQVEGRDEEVVVYEILGWGDGPS